MYKKRRKAKLLNKFRQACYYNVVRIRECEPETYTRNATVARMSNGSRKFDTATWNFTSGKGSKIELALFGSAPARLTLYVAPLE